MDEGFQYVVERKAQARICFLSGRERTTTINEKTQVGNQNLYTLQSSIDKVLNKVRSNRGVGGLASAVPRFPKDSLDQTPAPNRYNLDVVLCKKKGELSCLGGRASRFRRTKSVVPGPGSYNPYKTSTAYDIKKRHSFGGTASIIPVVDIRCLIKPKDRCENCGEICTDDYWQRKMSFMCAKCMSKLWFKKYSKSLEEYKKVRECSFIHQHDGTPFAICLQSRQALRRRVAKECYFDLYFDPH